MLSSSCSLGLVFGVAGLVSAPAPKRQRVAEGVCAAHHQPEAKRSSRTEAGWTSGPAGITLPPHFSFSLLHSVGLRDWSCSTRGWHEPCVCTRVCAHSRVGECGRGSLQVQDLAAPLACELGLTHRPHHRLGLTNFPGVDRNKSEDADRLCGFLGNLKTGRGRGGWEPERGRSWTPPLSSVLHNPPPKPSE